MADNHEHRLEMATSYGNGFARYRCTESGCDYWTDGREDDRTDEIARLRAEVKDLTVALDESVKLQSHYAKLLNEFDRGKRIGFSNAEQWMARLRVTGHLPPRRGT